jgi:hypothetical protein
MRIIYSILLFFCSLLPAYADNECKTYSECTALVLAAQNEAKASLARLAQVEEKIANFEAHLSRLETKINEEHLAINAAIKATTPRLVNRGIIKTITVKARQTAKTKRSPLGVSASEGFCALSQIGGRFDGTPENVAVFVSGGKWYYQFDHGAAYIYASIVCVAFSQISFE